MRKIFTILFFICVTSIFSQNYNMTNSNISTCSGVFYDSGGSGGSYLNSENYVMVICPSTPGSKLRLNFTNFNLESNFDFLTLYDGNNTSAPSLGVYTGVNGPGIIQASSSNTSGCITIRFTSDGSVTLNGWSANISCIFPCETITSVFNSSNPSSNSNGIIRVCQGQVINLNGSGIFSSGSSLGANYSWDFGNGTSSAFSSGTSASVSYNAPGVYAINLNINKGGCVNTNKLTNIVQVSTTPSFSATTTSTNTICLGQSVSLIGGVTPVPFIKNCTPPVSGTTFLPDGSGVSYSTCINVDCYSPGQTITSANDISNICLNMEHSYIGDLKIEILCPNGQSTVLKSHPSGSSTYLGCPLDDPAVGPGTGRLYCFTPTASTQLVNGTTSQCGTPSWNSIDAGNYAPSFSLNSLIGCPLNGGWCIKVTDNYGADNGYIFNWDLNFNVPAPAAQSFTPSIVSQVWTGPNITSVSGNNAIASPVSAGTTCYTLTATDNFGCSYSTVKCITVNAGPYAGSNNTLALCNSAMPSNLFSLLGSGVATNGIWSGPSPSLTGGYLGTFNPSGIAAGTYNYTYTVPSSGSCPPSTAIISVIIRPNPSATLSYTNPSCGNSNGIIQINNTSTGVQTITNFATSMGNINGQMITGLGASSPIITLTNNYGCTYNLSANLTMIPGPSNITVSSISATCGNSNGSVSFGSPVGGTAPYTYSFNGGPFSAGSPITGLASGTHSVSVKDINGCVYTKTVVVTNILGPSGVTSNLIQAGCGLSNGSYQITNVNGGVPAYTYSVDGVSTTSLTTGLSAGTHIILVKDANGCAYSTSFTINSTSGPTSAVITTTNATCGNSNGFVSVNSVTGGLSPYQYSFNGGTYTSSNSQTGLSAGLYSIIIKDVNSCTLTLTYNISNTGSPTASVTNAFNINCFGASNGSFTVASVGGTPPYTYTLSSPYQSNGTGQFNGLPQGLYNVTVKDFVGCITTASVLLTQPSSLTLSLTSSSVKCFGTASGTINVNGVGGTPAYEYNINGGAYQSSSVFANQSSGIYLIGVKDNHGCLASQTVVVNQPPSLLLQVSTQNANCITSNGVASTTVTGGTPNYSYSWSNGVTTASSLNGLSPGTYTVTVTDANNCIKSQSLTIGITAGGTATVTSINNITCNGFNDASITVSPIGGTAPYTYSWSPGGQTNSTVTNLSPGTYTCTITDFYGCKATKVETISQPAVLNIIASLNNVKCYGTATGTISVAGTGGTSPYTYMWPTIPSTLSTVSNIFSGNYVCVVTDANGCSKTQTLMVTQPSSISITSTVSPSTCGQANGSATVTATGGSFGSYMYSWSSGSTSISQGSLHAGTYTISVQDANSCIETLAVTIPDISGPSISISSQTNVSCYSGSDGVVTTTVSGGTGPYIYSWSNGNTSPIASNLTSNIYTVSVTDIIGCVSSTSVSISEPPLLSVGLVVSQPKCYGAINGYAIASAAGGTAGYGYSWSGLGGNSSTSNLLGAGNYNLVVTDAHGCVVTTTFALTNPMPMTASITSTNVSCYGSCDAIAIATVTNSIGAVNYTWIGGINPIVSSVANNLCVGTYTLLAVDQNSCSASSQIIITQPSPLLVTTISTGSVTCYGGNDGYASVMVSGGTGAYSYTWSPSGGNSANANNLIAGVYTVTVSDVNGCISNAFVSIIEPLPFTTTLTTFNPNCNGICDGVANISYSGGTGTTTFLWQPGLQTTNSVNNLCAGVYTVNITSNGSCFFSHTFTLVDPPSLLASSNSSASICGQATGQACATVTGGSLPYTYLWSNGVNTLCNNNIYAGAYTFTVTDANGCKAYTNALVNAVSNLVAAVTSQTNVSCFGGNNGGASVSVTGGNGGLTYLWSNGQTLLNPLNLTTGLYNLTVTDLYGCVGTASVYISQPTQLVSAISNYTNVSCFGGNNGRAVVMINGGTPPYVYNWLPSLQTTSLLTNASANTYTANIVDANGCIITSSVVISEPPALSISNYSITNVSCHGYLNGQISTFVQGGTPGYTYSWTPQLSSSNVLSGVPAGSYTLQVKDNKLCSVNSTYTVTQPLALTSTYTSSPSTCGISNGSVTLIVNGGTPSYTLNWNTSPVQQGFVATNMSPGNNWQCVITDLNGCSLTQTVNVNDAPSPVLLNPVVTQPSCFGLSNGSIALNFISGTSPYTISWSNPLSQTVTTSALTQSISGVAQGLYSVNLTDAYGCSTSQQIYVSQPGNLMLIVTPNQTICYGQTAQLAATGQNGSPVYTYTWFPNTISGSGPITVNPTIPTSYTVSVSDVNGCSPSPKVITINVTPPLNITGNSITLCHQNSSVISPTITSQGNGGPYLYSWSTSSVTTNSLTIVGNAPTLVTTNTINVVVDDGCTIPSASTIYTITTNPLPTATFTANILEACAPSLISFSATPGLLGNYSYSWIYDDKDEIATVNPMSYNFTTADTVSIKFVITDLATGCSNAVIKNDYILINKKPIASFYATPESASIVASQIDFTNTSQGASSYFWDFGDPSSGALNNTLVVNPSHFYNLVGMYNVHLVATSAKGCKDTARVDVEITPDFGFFIPNAFTPNGNGKNDIFQPVGLGINEDDYRMEIFDRWGELMFTTNNFRKGWDGSIKGSLKIAPQGVYIYKIEVYDKQGTKHPYTGHVTLMSDIR